MRDNLYGDDDSALITKRFWSHVKSASKSSRIPEFVTHNDITRSCPKEQAELFNEFFYQQFSDASNYSVPIDFTKMMIDLMLILTIGKSANCWQK
jgi:hypothetical protein